MNGKPEATASKQRSFMMRVRKYLWLRKSQQKLMMFVLMFLLLSLQMMQIIGCGHQEIKLHKALQFLKL